MSDIIAPAPAPANARRSRGLAPGALGPSLTLVRIDDRYVDYHEVVRPWLSIRRYAVIGLGVLVALFGGLAAWSILAPLATGTIAHGVIGVESSRKTIQHLEGGIVRTIHVREGDRVTAGDPLVTLNDTQARSAVGVIRAKLLAAMAHEARLTAQRDGQAEIRFPAELMAHAGEPESARIMTSHRDAFVAQQTDLDSKRQILRQQIRQYEDEIASVQAENTAITEQVRLIELESQDVELLLSKSLVPRPRLLTLQRTGAGLHGQIESNKALMARARQQIAEAELKILDLGHSFHTKVVDELRTTQEELANLRERALAGEDALTRTTIVAPQDGIVMNLRVFTLGGVVAAGAPLLDLVPLGDELIVTAKVEPQNREGLRPELPAYVVLPGLNKRTTPVLEAKVLTVSADRLEDPRTGTGYFQTRVRIGADQVAKLGDVRLYPGMPAEVKIVTGERSPIQYLTGPLADVFRRAFVNTN